VKFWDSSAIVPLCLREPSTAAIRALEQSDPSLVVWWATRIECLSAIVRRSREAPLDPSAEADARARLFALDAGWFEIQPSAALRTTAERLLALHPLRAADALQLAAALDWCEGRTTNVELVSLDRRLREAARREGLLVLPAEFTV